MRIDSRDSLRRGRGPGLATFAARTLLLPALSLALGALGCVRMAALPTAGQDVTLPLSEPQVLNAEPLELAKDPTRIYRVGPHDILHVEVRKDPSLTADYPVNDEGQIFLPNVGDIRVESLTTSEIENNCRTSLAKYIRFDPNEMNAEVRVGVKEYHSKIIYVIGQVANPGAKTMRADVMTLQEALYAAGLPTPDAAMQRALIVTPDMQKPIVHQVDLADVLYRGQTRENVLLKPNDTVYVPSRYAINISQALHELLDPVGQVLDIKYKAEFNNNNKN